MNLRISQIETMMKDSPEDSFLIHALALEYRKIDNFEKSQYNFEKNMELHPDYLGTYYAYGKLLESHQQFQKALEVYHLGLSVAQDQNDTKTYREIQSAIDWMDED